MITITADMYHREPISTVRRLADQAADVHGVNKHFIFRMTMDEREVVIDRYVHNPVDGWAVRLFVDGSAEGFVWMRTRHLNPGGVINPPTWEAA